MSGAADEVEAAEAEADLGTESEADLGTESESESDLSSESAEVGSAADDLLAAFGAPMKRAETQAEAEAETQAETQAEAESQPEQPAQADDVVVDQAAQEQPADDDAPKKAERPHQDSAASGTAAMSASAPALDPAAFFNMLRGSDGEQDGAGPGSPSRKQEDAAPAATNAQAPVPLQSSTAAWPTPPQPPAKHRALRIVLRWGAAVLTAAAVGAGTAFAVTLPKRTDVPGLATKNDGRYSFLIVAKPARPPGAATPKEDRLLTHPADLREYLLRAPIGATPDPAYPGASGWRSPKDFLADFAYADSMTADLSENGLRHIAAEGWTTPDGQHTMIELLQFPDDAAASQVEGLLSRNSLAHLKDPAETGEKVDVADLDGTAGHIDIGHYATVESSEPKIIAPKQGRSAIFTVGDVAVVVITTGPDHMPNVPTEQIVLLQHAMLQ